jgi:hypothetical protein
MKKIPTVFKRDPDDLKRVTREVHPDCRWVLDGQGEATRKYDGTCTMFDGERWWARREVKPGKTAPDGFLPVDTDEVTGKTQGWEPVERSAFAKFHAEALATLTGDPVAGDTYELVGPKVNGNPEKRDSHQLVRHGYQTDDDRAELENLPLAHDPLRDWLLAHDWEGIVWHHPDGRMAKLKRRDFPLADVG